VTEILTWATLLITQVLGDVDVVTLDPIQDGTLFSESQNSGGADNNLFAGRTSRGGLRRALIQFEGKIHSRHDLGASSACRLDDGTSAVSRAVATAKGREVHPSRKL
jgi:hypothetical protein